MRLLETRDFDHRAPGTVLRDVETLLGLVGDEGMPVTAGHVFAMRCLDTINRTLTQPLELHLKRAMQKFYPHINGLYLLLRSTGLGLIDAEPKKPRLKLDASILETHGKAPEQYGVGSNHRPLSHSTTRERKWLACRDAAVMVVGRSR